MTTAQALTRYASTETLTEEPEYGNWLRFWHEVQEAFDYVNARKAEFVGGHGWTVRRQAESEITVSILTAPRGH